MIVFVWAGEFVFRLLGVTPDTLSVAGGIALFIAGLPMMLKGDKEPEGGAEAIAQAEQKPQDWREVVVVPMTFPMSIGGTTASYVVSATGFAQNYVDLLAICVIVLLFCVVIWLTHLFSPPIGKALGPGGRDILTRVGGIVLVAISVQLVAGGLRGLFPVLGGRS